MYKSSLSPELSITTQQKIIGYDYFWCGDQLVEEIPLYADGTPAYEQSIHWLYQPEQLAPFARYEKGQLHYVITDHLGTPRELLNEWGKMEWGCEAETWGQRLASPAANDPHLSCPFRFPGQYEDKESGLHYNRYRYYDPATAQYISPDPIGLAGGINLYSYGPNPLSWIDPLGLSHLNTNGATGNFGVYKIEINGELYKYGKADMGRVTQSSGQPTRLHQQVRELTKIYGKGNVQGTVFEPRYTTTASAKVAETARLDAHYENTGKVPEGNQKSYKPKGKCG